MARTGKVLVVDASGEGVRFRVRDDEISSDDEIEAVWTRLVAAREPRCSKTRNDARACARNINIIGWSSKRKAGARCQPQSKAARVAIDYATSDHNKYTVLYISTET